MPGPSEKAPVKPLTLNFRSDIRHEERQKFDQFRKQKEAEHQAYKLQVDVPLDMFFNDESVTFSV